MIQPGYINGQHYSTYWDEVRELKATHQDTQLEHLLLTICDATEAEARHKHRVPVSDAFKELAVLYRKQNQFQQEIAILERYLQIAGSQAKPELKDRLEKVKQMINL